MLSGGTGWQLDTDIAFSDKCNKTVINYCY